MLSPWGIPDSLFPIPLSFKLEINPKAVDSLTRHSMPPRVQNRLEPETFLTIRRIESAQGPESLSIAQNIRAIHVLIDFPYAIR